MTSLSENSIFTSSPYPVPYQILIFPQQHHNQPPGTCLQDRQLEMAFWAEVGHLKGGELLSVCKRPSPVGRKAEEEITVNDMIYEAGGWFVFPKPSANLRSWARIPAHDVFWGKALCVLFIVVQQTIP